MGKMKVVYIAGPFRAATLWDLAEHVRAAERVALRVARAGAMTLCPHSNTWLFHGQLNEEFWLEGTRELLRRSDAGVFIPGWTNSHGSRTEWADAEERNQPRFDLELEDHPTRGWAAFERWLHG